MIMIYPRICDLREERDLKKKQISALIGVQKLTYCNYENCTRGLLIDVLIRLADDYQTSMDYIVGRTDKREPY